MMEMDHCHPDVSVYIQVCMYVGAIYEDGPEVSAPEPFEYLDSVPTDGPMDLALRFVDD